jgi:hypothetical protein
MPDIATAPKLGRRVLSLSGDLILQMFESGDHRGYRVISDAIPADARVVDVRWDGFGEMLKFYVVSAAFASDDAADYDHWINPVCEVMD